MTLRHYDVCVIGGGPAGAVTAFRLACLGYSVLIIHRISGQDVPVIESLSWGSWKLLEELGLRDVLEATGSRGWTRSTVWWRSSVAELSPEVSLLLRRQSFDERLLSAALRAGASAHQGSAKEPFWFEESQKWRVRLDSDSEVTCSFLADASGRRNILGGTKKLHGPPTIALSAYWRGPERGAAESFVEAGRSAWCWGARLHDGLFRAIVFVDLPKDRKSLGSEKSRENFYSSRMRESELVGSCLGYEQVSSVRLCEANVYLDQAPVSRPYIKLGDASLTLDPLSSQGIQRALASGLQGSIVINTILRKPDVADLAIAFYKTRLMESLLEHRRTAASLYRSTYRPLTDFWKLRSVGEVSDDLESRRDGLTISETDFVLPSSEVRIVETACVEGNFVTPGRALTHPALSQPIAYLGSIPVVHLLESMGSGSSVRRLREIWHQFRPEDMRRCMNWLASKELIAVRPAC
jgi:flavin-dependent dehydrogenase